MTARIILQILLIVFMAVFTYTETAVIAISDPQLEKLAAGGSKRAVRLKRLTEKPTRFMEIMRTASIFAAALGSAFLSYDFARLASDAVKDSFGNIPTSVVRAAVIAVMTLIFTVITLIFGILLPKGAAMKDPEKAALRMSLPAVIITAFFAPAVFISKAVSNGLLRLIGVDPNGAEETVTEEEILMMSDAGAEKGTIDEDENRIIKNVFAFDDMTAGQVCTHRTEVSVLWEADSTDVWEETIHRTRHSVFPVCGESVDNVTGVLDAKDYFRLDDKSRENIMKNAVREPYFVHENMKADRLFEQMKQSGSDHFAVVVDEYGGMSGIITVTDLVEQLVGEFSDDEDDVPQPHIEKTGDNMWLIPGTASVAEVSEELDITIPADNFETFGGYVIDELGDVPREGTQISFEADGLRVEVVAISHHRIESCRVEKIAPHITEPENEDQ